MSFFPRGLYEADASSFTPLFRLLDDFDSYTRQASGHDVGGRRRGTIWQPKFDVRETEEAYELHGELPGINKDAVQIEFTEPQTMSIRGRSERTYTEGDPSAGQIEDVTDKPAITQTGEGSHKATAQDEGAENAVDKSEAGQGKGQPSKYKYWLTERSVGEFSRVFNFPTPVQHDAVSASFKDGILTVTVPKAKKPEARRITIN
ncbi:heat shock protein 30 [Metarhizium album ARSEF 1941]|uniref:Heat shock protein 30 n=1 Tax=Metarhizium album (strain ARSEF 1941) TaxID=1081103 RepID=A0A0B2X0G4_METAS|nr:heat shock protein 30 [Metarhizium album ARSEF 1941]KHN99758.1 heat shock protein 30 [Metarhizium album ARSEF 1941]